MYHHFLIASQFILAATIVMSDSWLPPRWGALLLAVPGVMLALWSWLEIGPLSLRIHPTTTDSTRLIRSGPYRFVRHPMYAGLLWFTAALAFTSPAWWHVATWMALVGVLVAKAGEEEKSLCLRFSEYTVYQEEVGKLFPRLFNKIPAKN